MKTIGFATEYYTLWDVRVEPKYFTDLNGVHHLQSNVTHYNYIQNISKDLATVKDKYPDLSINEELKGKTAAWSKTSEDLTPEILKFGKYSGKSVQEVSEIDFHYILWLLENGRGETIKVCMALPIVIAHFEAVEIKRNQAIASHPVIESGEVELTFYTNPNKIGQDLDFILRNSSVLGEIPSTLVWNTVNEYSSPKSNDWFVLESAKPCNGSSYDYRISKYKDSPLFSLNGHNYDTIEEAKREAEIQELSNQHTLENFYQPTAYAPFLNKYFAVASIGEGNTIYVFFDDVKVPPLHNIVRQAKKFLDQEGLEYSTKTL